MTKLSKVHVVNNGENKYKTTNTQPIAFIEKVAGEPQWQVSWGLTRANIVPGLVESGLGSERFATVDECVACIGRAIEAFSSEAGRRGAIKRWPKIEFASPRLVPKT